MFFEIIFDIFFCFESWFDFILVLNWLIVLIEIDIKIIIFVLLKVIAVGIVSVIIIKYWNEIKIIK